MEAHHWAGYVPLRPMRDVQEDHQMRDEALRMALEALEWISNLETGRFIRQKATEPIAAIKQARALDKKAENARELGLDYEPAQRTWVGLTDKEIEEIWKIAMFTDYGIGAELSNQPFVHYARAIEAKLKQKNS
jgi:hypothetical protein